FVDNKGVRCKRFMGLVDTSAGWKAVWAGSRERNRSGDERGQILLLIALSIVVIIGVMSLTLDASFMYEERNRLHAAADAAAKSAALEVFRGNSLQAHLDAFAQRE